MWTRLLRLLTTHRHHHPPIVFLSVTYSFALLLIVTARSLTSSERSRRLGATLEQRDGDIFGGSGVELREDVQEEDEADHESDEDSQVLNK